jgi:hypothetical protein
VLIGKLFKRLELLEQQHIMLTIVALTDERRTAVTCYDLAQTLGVIGVADDAPADLSTNPDYLNGFGRR